jgi:hypothetical protein
MNAAVVAAREHPVETADRCAVVAFVTATTREAAMGQGCCDPRT